MAIFRASFASTVTFHFPKISITHKKARDNHTDTTARRATEDQLHPAEERRALPVAGAITRTPEATAGTSFRVVTNEMRHA